MKLRLIQQGFEKYTGQMGVTFFEDGLSTTDVRVLDATRMAAVMQCEWEDGTTASVAQRLLDEANTGAPMLSLAEIIEQEDVEAVPSETKQWTQEELEAIADAKGISGLRAIGDPMNVKATSVKKLIEEILAENDK